MNEVEALAFMYDRVRKELCPRCKAGVCSAHMPSEQIRENNPGTEQENRIKAALEFATWGQVDGAHHKAWAIDQMFRALTGCPMVTKTAIDVNGRTYTYETQGESDEYLAWVRAYENNDDDADPEDRYHWDTGIIP